MSGKRAKGEGSVHKLPGGRWQSQIMDGYKDNGKRKIISFTAGTRAEALDRLHEYLQNKDKMKETQAAPKTVLFGDYAVQWYKAYRSQVEASTYANYRYTLAILNKQFGECELSNIKVTEINQFINSLEEHHYSASQISKCRSMLIQILDCAESDDLIPKNYARRAFQSTRRIKNSNQLHTKDSFTKEEVEIIFNELPKDLLGYSIRLMLISGLRLQELLALTPEDIAEDGSWVKVSKAVKMVDGIPVLGVPKSTRSRRIVPIAPKFRDIAVWLRENGGQAFIWCAPKRESLLYATYTVRRRYYHALEKIPNVRKLSPHSCRHTYVSMLQAEGVPMETIARLTGHTDIKVTDQYLHISNETLTSAVAALESVV